MTRAVAETHRPGITRRDLGQIGLAGLLVALAGIAHYLDVNAVVAFAAAAVAIALLARLVGTATDELGGRVGSSAAGVVQSALGQRTSFGLLVPPFVALGAAA